MFLIKQHLWSIINLFKNIIKSSSYLTIIYKITKYTLKLIGLLMCVFGGGLSLSVFINDCDTTISYLIDTKDNLLTRAINKLNSYLTESIINTNNSDIVSYEEIRSKVYYTTYNENYDTLQNQTWFSNHKDTIIYSLAFVGSIAIGFVIYKYSPDIVGLIKQYYSSGNTKDTGFINPNNNINNTQINPDTSNNILIPDKISPTNSNTSIESIKSTYSNKILYI